MKAILILFNLRVDVYVLKKPSLPHIFVLSIF